MDGHSILEKILRIFAVVSITAMFATVLLQIGGRHFLRSAPPWTEELGRLLIVWLVAIGAGFALRHHGYRGAVEALADLLPAKGRRLLNLAFMAIIAAFLGVLTYQSVNVIGRNMNVHAPALGLPMSYFYLGVLVMAVLLLWAIGHQVIAELMPRRGRGKEPIAGRPDVEE